MAILLAEALGPEAFASGSKSTPPMSTKRPWPRPARPVYSAKHVGAVPAELRDKYFEHERQSLRLRTRPAPVVIFGRHNLVQDAPISRLDLLLCRNTLMYFNAETQARILARFHFALNDDGFLFLGKAEMLLTQGNLFTPLELKHRIFAKVAGPRRAIHLLPLPQAGNEEAAGIAGSHVRLREAAFDATSAAQIVIDLKGGLVLANFMAQAMLA